MIEWQLYWKGWWKRPLWESWRDKDFDIGITRCCWIISVGPLQVRKIWYEEL